MNPVETPTSIEEVKKEEILFVERRPTANPFFKSISDYRVEPKEKTVLQKFEEQLRGLEKVALSGDLKGWQEKFPQVTASAQEASVDPSKDLHLRVQIKKLELTVMLQAASKAKIAAKHLEEEATKAQLKKDVDQSKKLLTQAQKLTHLAEKLKNQLMSKTS
jgi:hypothetical protein